MARLAIAVALVCLFAGAQAQPRPMPTGMPASGSRDAGSIMIQFDNRGSKVEGKQKQIATALSKLFQVPASQISFGGVTGQSTLFNHQSVATFNAVGPTLNGKTVFDNCVDAVKKGWFTKSQVSKQLNRATDSWMPGDSVKVEKATCGAPGRRPVAGRKLL